MIGVDVYGSIERLRDDLSAVGAFAARHHKPFALTEVGIDSRRTPQFWTSELLPARRALSNQTLFTSIVASLLGWSNCARLTVSFV